MLANREDVEQRLRGVFVRAVAGVEDVATEMFGEELRGAGGAVSDDHLIDAHGLDGEGRVDEGFAFGEAAAGGGEVDRIGAEAFGSEAEAGSGSGGGFEEQVGDDGSAEVVGFWFAAIGPLLELGGAVENAGDFLGGEFFEGEQMASGPEVGGGVIGHDACGELVG